MPVLRALFVITLLLPVFPGRTFSIDTPHVAIVVDALDDGADLTGNDCTCATIDNTCTLRAALQTANACPGPDSIHFAVAGTITPFYALPTLSDTTGGTFIDGYTAPGALPNSAPITQPVDSLITVALYGGNQPFHGLHLTSPNNGVRGLAIYGFDNDAVAPYYSGILIEGGRSNVVAGNLIGFDPGSLTSSAYQRYGVQIRALAKQNVIGGSTAADRNVISGNTYAAVRIEGNLTLTNTVQGNFIGPAPQGDAALPGSPQLYGVSVVNVAYDTGVQHNLISGNGVAGVMLADSSGGSLIEYNTIGPAANGDSLLQGNSQDDGIWLSTASKDNVVRANLVSGNLAHGVRLTGTGTAGNRLEGNVIGPAAAGGPLNGSAQAVGVKISGGASNNRLGDPSIPEARNTISHNTMTAVAVQDDTTRYNRIQGNDLATNGPGALAPGIDLGADGISANDPGDSDEGPNRRQNRPEISDITPLIDQIQVRVRVDSNPASVNYPMTIDIYQAEPGAAVGEVAASHVFIGQVSYSATDAGLTVTRRFTPLVMPATGDLIVATATDALGNTGEFSLAAPTNIPALNVTDLGDAADLDGSDCTCATASSTCTLRAALETANACPGSNAIAFSVAGIITPTTPLPPLADSSGGVLLDAFTAPGAQVNTRPVTSPIDADLTVGLDGAQQPFAGLNITSNLNQVRGLAIYGFGGGGIIVSGGAGNEIAGNYIGTSLNGAQAPPGQPIGIQLQQGAHDNQVGGTSPEGRNLLSGNIVAGVVLTGTGTLSNTLVGNMIGPGTGGSTPPAGATQQVGIWLGAGAGRNVIGDVVYQSSGALLSGARNIISGNALTGIYVTQGAHDNVIVGNTIGPAANGNVAIYGSTQSYGVWIDEGQGQQIGRVQQGNLISGNLSAGVRLHGAATSGNVVRANLIGPASSGTSTLTGGFQAIGIELAAGASGNLVGGTPVASTNSPGNYLRYNQVRGIVVIDDDSLGNRLEGNILLNTPLPVIDLGNDDVTPNDPDDVDEGPNRRQNYPEISGFAIDPEETPADLYQVTLRVDSAPLHASYPLTVQVFAADDLYTGRPKTFIGSVLYTAEDAQAVVTKSLVPVAIVPFWQTVVATATDADGNTSEVGPAFCPAANPDVNDSGKVDIVDIMLVTTFIGRTPIYYDANCDGTVNTFDLTQLANAWQP